MKKNLIKLYFYVTAGQAVVDKFRYLIAGVLFSYAAIKLTNPWFILLMLMCAIPVLFIVGWYYTHRVSKISEELSVKYGTHYGIKQFELVEKQVEILEEINKKIK